MSDYRELLLKREEAVKNEFEAIAFINQFSRVRSALIGDLLAKSVSTNEAELVKQIFEIDVKLAGLQSRRELANVAKKSAQVEIDQLVDAEVERRDNAGDDNSCKMTVTKIEEITPQVCQTTENLPPTS